jgi:hypothetical protein
MTVTGIEAARALWHRAACTDWLAARAQYGRAIEASGGPRLAQLDAWYHDELLALLAARSPVWLSLDELVEVVQWKMHRGTYRARNLALVRQNTPDEVVAASRAAFALMPHPGTPIAKLSALKGVGPATASAVVAAARPDLYPFFDDVAAAAIPDFGRVEYTAKGYARFSERLRERAVLLAVGCPADDWTPHAVECALWAAAGGKPAA